LNTEFLIRPIETRDDPFVAQLIRDVMPEFNASGPGFAINDPEVDCMTATYANPRARYYVVEHAGRILGAGGFGPLIGGDDSTCEVKKMYFYPAARGSGVGSSLLDLILQEAATTRYTNCYLETLEQMAGARRLYEKKGFTYLKAPMGATGHGGCDRWMQRSLKIEK